MSQTTNEPRDASVQPDPAPGGAVPAPGTPVVDTAGSSAGTSAGTAAGATSDDVQRAEDRLDLLGLLAYTELTSFARLAASSEQAPAVRERLELARYAARAVQRQGQVLARIAELGGDPTARIAGFDGIYDDYEARTTPSTWWEGLLKGYVGHGIVDDFCRLAVDGLDEASRAVVLEVVLDSEADESAADELLRAAQADAAVASRLALWGRRLVGESLGVVQALLASRPGLARLIAAGAARDAAERPGAVQPRTDQAWVLSRLTAEHTRRMGRLGLAA
ncbi:ferritin-like fold-containing protein [Sediminihabitans luteus]|uniref:ferritin-like fold-containing protein n=1 Tax=Sediminihabitans luteus TaxID=1138585 RepID=UPI001EF248FF|nr:ferritin-like fold-containing protein [Sediminihabitans luteus]